MTERRIRLVFVTSQFSQGGAERYLFETCRALDRKRFDIDILTCQDVDRAAFYYQQLRGIGVPIHEKLPPVPDLGSQIPALARSAPYRAAARRIGGALVRSAPYRAAAQRIGGAQAKRALGGFLDAFDLVCIIQIENYFRLQHGLKSDGRTIVHLTSNRFQYQYDFYDDCLADRRYRFIVCDKAQAVELGDLKCLGYDVFEWPLSMDFTNYPVIPMPPPSEHPRIGIFTRLSAQKPLDTLFEAFRALRQRLPATLHVYGAGDRTPSERVVASLGLTGHVFFEGHRPDMLRTLQDDGLSMCWLMSVDTLLGFASIEIAAAGVPILFFNFGKATTDDVLSQTGGAMHTFQLPDALGRFAADCLTGSPALATIAARLRDYIRKRHDIHRNIGRLENYYEAVAGASALGGINRGTNRMRARLPSKAPNDSV